MYADKENLNKTVQHESKTYYRFLYRTQNVTVTNML